MLSSKDEELGWILGFHITISLTNMIYKQKFKGRQGQFWLEIRAPQRSWYLSFSSVKFSHSVVSDSLWPHGLQHARPPCPSPAPTRSLLMTIELVMPSNHLILCHPLLLLPSIFPNIRVFSNESAFLIRWPKYWSFSFSISLSNEHSGLISFRIDWLDLLAVQGTLKSVLQTWTMSEFQWERAVKGEGGQFRQRHNGGKAEATWLSRLSQRWKWMKQLCCPTTVYLSPGWAQVRLWWMSLRVHSWKIQPNPASSSGMRIILCFRKVPPAVEIYVPLQEVPAWELLHLLLFFIRFRDFIPGWWS